MVLEYAHLQNWLVGGDWNHGILCFSHHIGNVIIPTDELIFFQRGRAQPPTSWLGDFWGVYVGVHIPAAWFAYG